MRQCGFLRSMREVLLDGSGEHGAENPLTAFYKAPHIQSGAADHIAHDGGRFAPIPDIVNVCHVGVKEEVTPP